MANALYGYGRQAFGDGDIDWVNDTIKATLIDTNDYSVQIDTHRYMNTDTVPAAAKVATVTLANKSNVLGVCDAADAVFPAVTGDESEALIIWKDGGGGGETADGTTDLLIVYIDTAAYGLPVTPNGGDINVNFDNGANKIFKL